MGAVSQPLVETTEVDGEGAGRPGLARMCLCNTVSTKQNAPRDRYSSGRGAQASSAFHPFPTQSSPFLGGQECVLGADPWAGGGSTDEPTDRRVYVPRPLNPLDRIHVAASGRILAPSPRDGTALIMPGV